MGNSKLTFKLYFFAPFQKVQLKVQLRFAFENQFVNFNFRYFQGKSLQAVLFFKKKIILFFSKKFFSLFVDLLKKNELFENWGKKNPRAGVGAGKLRLCSE